MDKKSFVVLHFQGHNFSHTWLDRPQTTFKDQVLLLMLLPLLLLLLMLLLLLLLSPVTIGLSFP